MKNEEFLDMKFPYRNLKKRFEERKKRRKANLSRRRRRSVGRLNISRLRQAVVSLRRIAVAVRWPTARLSVQIPSHRLPSLASTSCEIFDPNERPPAKPAPLSSPPPCCKLERGTCSSIWALRAGETTSFCPWRRNDVVLV